MSEGRGGGSGRNVRANTRAHDRAAGAILALRGEISRRIEALNALAAEEEACHAETIAWMADTSRGSLPETHLVEERCEATTVEAGARTAEVPSEASSSSQPGYRRRHSLEAPPLEAKACEPGDNFSYTRFAAIVESIEAESDRTVEAEFGDTTLHDLARGGDFEGLVQAVAAYKQSCFGNDTIDVDAAQVKELVLESSENPIVLRRPRVFDRGRAARGAASKADQKKHLHRPPFEALEDDYELEIRRKLMLCRFYALEVSHASERPGKIPGSSSSVSRGAAVRGGVVVSPRNDPAASNPQHANLRGGTGPRPLAAKTDAPLSKSSSSGSQGAGRDRKPTKTRQQRCEFNELEQWTLNHIEKPYPSQEDKMLMAEQLKMTVGQVQHWFSNMRKRKYFPVCERRRAPRDDFEVVLLQAHQEASKQSPNGQSPRIRPQNRTPKRQASGDDDPAAAVAAAAGGGGGGAAAAAATT